MKKSKFLTPLKSSTLKHEIISDARRLAAAEISQNTQRAGRDHLKQYLSSNDIKVSCHSNKKTFELTENNLYLPTSPRVLQKIAYSTDGKSCMKEKCLDKMIALKLANKNVLKLFSSFNHRKEEPATSPVLITVPEELQALDIDNSSERSEATKLLKWFEVMEKSQLESSLNEENFQSLTISEQEHALDVAESILSLAMSRLPDQVKTHCSEKAIMVGKLFESYKKYWIAEGKIRERTQEHAVKEIYVQLAEAKAENVSIIKESKAEIQSVLYI